MKTLWRQKRQECFHIQERELKPFTFDTERLVYGNVNLSIFLTDKCNATCDFCVAELRYLNTGNTFVKPCIKDDEEYYARVEEVIERIKPINPSVSITGGEPTHCHRLSRVCQLLNKHNVRKRTITTNGSGLLNRVGNKTILDTLIENGFQHLNISKAHYNPVTNQRIMKFRQNELTDMDLATIVETANPNGLRVRLSCVLTKDGIGTVPAMKQYMDYAERQGVDNVVFRELMKYDTDMLKQGRVYDFCERNRVSLNDVWEQLDNDPDFHIINQVLGYYYYVEVYKYRGIDMVSESADLKQIAVEKAKPSDKPVVYEMVLHPNGCLNGSWREWEDLLLNYESKL